MIGGGIGIAALVVVIIIIVIATSGGSGNQAGSDALNNVPLIDGLVFIKITIKIRVFLQSSQTIFVQSTCKEGWSRLSDSSLNKSFSLIPLLILPYCSQSSVLFCAKCMIY